MTEEKKEEELSSFLSKPPKEVSEDKICKVCGKEVDRGMPLHMKTHQVEKIEGLEKDVLGLKVNMESVIFGQDAILRKLEEIGKPKTEWLHDNQKEETVDQKIDKILSEEPDEYPISPKWRQLVDVLLGKDFGIHFNGTMFTIDVPREKSNATSSHWDFYKCDKRSIPYNPAEGSEGIKKYIERVRQNLTRKINKPI